ncbi:MAG TPA: efflux RND transporter periplasmic adaptor subunit [Phycisphaerae bacterium]|nr:efflux RND transporter periplasmic adaptor subunit [Phycisphaerae bacterium]HRY69187.1 efflux RND transporter periplasmic adaptor subunit [Phycisphaerae bacterium]HSA26148.1 efflux RND transporter periplasmic adaptor subunit [Phycisphaerae bacterium]
MRGLLVVIVVLAAAAGGGYAYWHYSEGEPPSYRTAVVQRGDLLVSISATGTVEPEEVIDVGAQVAGRIEMFGQDPRGETVDYSSPVEVGTVLAHIDDSLYAADVAQAEAQLEQAKASVLKAQADLEQMKAKLHQAEKNWTRAKELGISRALSATDFDSYEAAYETAKATVGVGEATIVQAQKAVLQSEASLRRFRTNLGYCTIKSPVKGIIIARRVNIGQTVVASLNAPSLFLIAKDLTRMQVWASVNEADIGRITVGQPVSFTVDAHPGEVFHGEVSKIRLNASMTQNVVTYTVEITTDNSNGRLLPYLTANVQFEVTRRKDVLMVANAALRYVPAPEQVVPEARAESGGMGSRGMAASPSGWAVSRPVSSKPAGSGPPGVKRSQNKGTVWVQDGLLVRPVAVDTGLTDGSMTEVPGGVLNEGMEVVIGEVIKIDGGGTRSPFTPQIRSQRRPQ